MTNNPRLLATSGPRRALGSRKAGVVLTKTFDLSRAHLSMYEIVKWFFEWSRTTPIEREDKNWWKKAGLQVQREGKTASRRRRQQPLNVRAQINSAVRLPSDNMVFHADMPTAATILHTSVREDSGMRNYVKGDHRQEYRPSPIINASTLSHSTGLNQRLTILGAVKKGRA